MLLAARIKCDEAYFEIAFGYCCYCNLRSPIVSSEVAKFILCLIFVSFIAMPVSNRVLKLEVKE